jgi:multidrug resistance efflux pump
VQQSVSQADALQLAQLTAQKYIIAAPRAGVVTQVPIHQGEVVQPGQMIGGVADLSTLKLTAWVLERDLSKVSVGQVVQVTADPFPGKTFGVWSRPSIPRRSSRLATSRRRRIA